MARKARQRISYVIPLANSATGHRLGVNGLAVDIDRSVLYSGGRDGVICAWDLARDLRSTDASEHDAKPTQSPQPQHQRKVQAHTHWINDIKLVQSNTALVSASSDITVKLWRPDSADQQPPQTLGLHSDYIKTLASPSSTADWVASGALDRKINVWDLSGAGQKLSIDAAADEITEGGGLLSREKASIYALAATESMIASGGPASTIKVWDPRSGKRTTKLVGHTDIVRDILISQDGTTILSASSDRTVKVWSTAAGRCLSTLTMHDASVWSLYSSQPDLRTFYSSDRNGLVAKTDTHDLGSIDDGLSIAICQENEGVHRVVAAGGSIWTGTSRPSINCWADVNTENAEIDVPEHYFYHRSSLTAQKIRFGNGHRESLQSYRRASVAAVRKLPFKHMLRLSNTAYFPSPMTEFDRDASFSRRGTTDGQPPDLVRMQPVRTAPDYSIEGQNGLKQGVILNDRRRALTLDTAGEVVMWDLLRCKPIKTYGRRDIDEVKDEETNTIMVANWCSIHTKTGSLSVVLEENTCFDAEVYIDELEQLNPLEYREDQRVNLGKWVLRYLFAELVQEEERRDEVARTRLLSSLEREGLKRENAPTSIELPPLPSNGWNTDASNPHSGTTLRPGANGVSALTTPGLHINLATPAFSSPTLSRTSNAATLTPPAEDGPARSQENSQRGSSEHDSDYFSSPRAPTSDPAANGNGVPQAPMTPNPQEQDPQTPLADAANKDATAATPGKEGFFGKKLRMGMSFGGMKKIGRTQTNENKPAIEEGSAPEVENDSTQVTQTRINEDNFLGVVQRMRYAYEDSLQQQIAARQALENGLPGPAVGEIGLPTLITPSLPSETPVLDMPPQTTILIQEDRPEAGGVADLFESTVGALGRSCDAIERVAPMWLGDVLLRNQIPLKEVVKISFVLEPYANELPPIASDGNNRLNANRMLRAKKISGYVAERLEPPPPPVANGETAEEELRPEEYLELWCQNQLVPPNMTLATLRSHLWRGGGDVMLYYRANGRKKINFAGTSGYPPKAPEKDDQEAPATNGVTT